MRTNPISPDPDLQTIILNAISDAVYLTDRNGDFTFVCQNVDIIFGYSQEEVEAFENVLFDSSPKSNRFISDRGNQKH